MPDNSNGPRTLSLFSNQAGGRAARMERRERTIPGSLEQMQEYRMQVAQAASAAAEVRALRPLLLAAARATPHAPFVFTCRALLANRTPQAVGLGHVDRTLQVYEQRMTQEQMWPDLRGPPAHLVPPLLPIGSLSLCGGPWQKYATAAPPSRKASPPRFGFPDGFRPRRGVYH